MNLRNFALRIFQHCPLTSEMGPDRHETAYTHWIGYKKRIPVRGLILLNKAMDSVLLVKGWSKSSSWMFPRGKIDEGEDDLDCAVREVYEETGFNARDAGLIPENRVVKSFDMIIRDQHVKLFVIPDVPMDFPFGPRTRKEISDIQWFRLVDLPTGRAPKKQGPDGNAAASNAYKFFLVSSFLGHLNKWIRQQRKKADRSRNSHRNGHLSQPEIEDGLTEEEGMTTETAPEPPPAFTSMESYEAASKKLHSLLKIQATSQRPQEAGAAGAEQDKGKAILAMLRQQQDAPAPTHPPIQQHSYMPHNPMDHIYNVASQPQTRHHHATHTLASGSHQAAPSFAQPDDINNKLRSVLGVSGTSMEQEAQQQTQTSNQQVEMMMASAPGYRPALAHPQPLPRQANHILTGAQSPAVRNDRPVQVQPQLHMAGSLPAGMNLPQQLVANLRQPPPVLDHNRLALLNAFRKDASSPKESVLKDPSPQPPAPDSHRSSQQQSVYDASLGSPYGGRILAGVLSPNGLPSTTIPQQGSPNLTVPETALRPSNVSQTQQRALLDIFKQPSGLSPKRDTVEPCLKENRVPSTLGQGSLQQQSSPVFNTGLATRSVVPETNNGLYAEVGLNLPYGAMHPSDANGPAHQHQQQPPQPGVRLLSAFAVDGAGAENGTQARNSPAGQHQCNATSRSPYANLDRRGQPVMANAAISFPNMVPRPQDTDPQHREKLMSLFSAPTAGLPARGLASPAAINGKAAGLYDAGHAASPSSRMGAIGASPGLDGARGAASMSMSRRSSQQHTPISPENEKFLLNYLKSATGSSK